MKKLISFLIGKYRLSYIVVFGFIALLLPGLFAFFVFGHSNYSELSILKIITISLCITSPVGLAYHMLGFYKYYPIDVAIEIMGTIKKYIH
jgi:hypothetical protein